MKKITNYLLTCFIILLSGNYSFAQFGNLQNQIKSPIKTTTAPSSTSSGSNTKSSSTSSSPTSTNNSSTSSASAPLAEGKHYYVSITRGKGKVGSKEEPAKDLGNIIAILLPGDIIHVAEGLIYQGVRVGVMQ